MKLQNLFVFFFFRFKVAVFCCQGATLYGLLRSTLALVGLVLFLPLAGIATTILPIVAILKHFADIALSSRILMSILVIIVPMVLAYYKRRRSIGSNFVKMQVNEIVILFRKKIFRLMRLMFFLVRYCWLLFLSFYCSFRCITFSVVVPGHRKCRLYRH